MRRDFEFGDTCYVKGRSAVKIIAIKPEKTLVKYYFIGNIAIANMCPSGTLYFVATDTIKELYTPLASFQEADWGTKEEKAKLLALQEEVKSMLEEANK